MYYNVPRMNEYELLESGSDHNNRTASRQLSQALSSKNDQLAPGSKRPHASMGVKVYNEIICLRPCRIALIDLCLLVRLCGKSATLNSLRLLRFVVKGEKRLHPSRCIFSTHFFRPDSLSAGRKVPKIRVEAWWGISGGFGRVSMYLRSP